MPAGYDSADAERRVPDPPRDPGRSPFARDRARVVHASALRRLAGKTQVVHPGSDDFVRNRLTHTLEVAQIGRELGRALGCDPDVVETACLAHDLGHPPFGHNGEQALDEAARAVGGFEGNAQTLRLLTRLEVKTLDAAGRSAGLNLTRASLDAATKYPWFADSPRAASGKYGAYAEDAEAFHWLRAGAPGQARCLEAQVMDWADDVAYSVHDLEDGLQSGLIDLRALADDAEVELVAEVAVATYVPDAHAAALADALRTLRALPAWPSSYDGGRRDLAALKELTSVLIGRFSRAAEQTTRALAGTGVLTRYASELAVPESVRLEVAVLKAVAAHYVMRAEGRRAVLEEQRAVVTDLVSVLCERPDLLDAASAEDFAEAHRDSDRLRVVVDAVASLTDASAMTMHRRTRGS